MTTPDYGAMYRLMPASRAGEIYLVPSGPDAMAGAVTDPRPGLECTVGGGTRAYDILSVGAIGTLISARAREAMLSVSAASWHVVDVGKYAALAEGLEFHGRLVVTGRAGAIDRAAATKTMSDPGPYGKRPMPVIRGMRFVADEWDGSDVFVPEGTAAVVVTQAAKKALVKAKVTNAWFQLLDEWEEFR